MTPSRIARLLRRMLGYTSGAAPSTFMRAAYRVPRQVVLVTTRHAGRDNVWPMDWHMPLSFDPKLYCISITKGSYGEELIHASGVFIVHFVPAAWEEKIFALGSQSGRNVDKFAAAGLATEPAATVDAPRIAGTLGFLECRVDRAVDAGDHTLFIARVTHEEARGDAPRLHHIDTGMADAAGQFEAHGR